MTENLAGDFQVWADGWCGSMTILAISHQRSAVRRALKEIRCFE